MRTNFNMRESNITMVRGDTVAFGLEIDGLDGLDLDTAYLSCKANPQATSYIFRKTLGNGIEKLEDGKYTVRIAPEDTRHINAGRYWYDLQIGVNGDVYTLLLGMLVILQDISS